MNAVYMQKPDFDQDNVKAECIFLQSSTYRNQRLVSVCLEEGRKRSELNAEVRRGYVPTNNQSRLMLILGLQDNWIISADLNFYFFYIKN